jgi:hypothetical protein
MTKIQRTIIASGVLAAVVLLAATADARIGGHTNHVTFSGPVALPGIGLGTGTYIFELTDLDPRLVRVFNADRSRLYFTGFTRAVARPATVRRDRIVSFAETRPGVPPRIAAWYPVGASTGYEFLYTSK